MNRKRIILLLTLCVAFTLAAQGQRFDWVNTFTGPGATNRIVGSCVDSEGNYYFIGECSPRAQLCGVRILPDSIVTQPYSAIVIAKISPQGNLLWHKAIYGTLRGAYPCALWQLGDTALMVMAYMNRSREYGPSNTNKLYYLDTLLTGNNNNYPIPSDSLYKGIFNAFITFRNDGTVIEQHFLCRGLLDTTGHLLTPKYVERDTMDNRMYDEILSNESFCVDSVGNIYVLRMVNDFCTYGNVEFRIDTGNIGALKIVVDGIRSLYCPTQRTSFHNQQILKFSPHFDSILASTYVFDSTWLQPRAGLVATYGNYDLNMDSRGNLYLGLMYDRVESPLRISGSDSLFMDTVGPRISMTIKYNSDLQPLTTAQLSFTASGLLVDADGRTGINAFLQNSHIDETTNSVFLTGICKWAPAPYRTPTCTLFYNGDTLDLAQCDGFWLRLDMDDLRLLSIGKVRPDSRYEHGGEALWIRTTTQNNRVFGQTIFTGGIVFGDSTLLGQRDHAFLVWGYDGNELFGTNFHHCGTTTLVDSPHVIDSIVYLAGTFDGNSTFGTIAVPTQGATYAYIAKYVDTAFMTPYVIQDTRNTQQINWPQELSFPLSDTLVQLTATSTSGLPVTYTCSDTSIARVEGATLHLLAEGAATVTASQNGNSQYHPATPVVKPLRVGQTGIKTGSPQRFLVYPNPAHNTVYYSTNELVKSVKVISSQGRTMEIPFNNNQVDISTLPSGVYYFLFVTEKNIHNYKIIKP